MKLFFYSLFMVEIFPKSISQKEAQTLQQIRNDTDLVNITKNKSLEE